MGPRGAAAAGETGAMPGTAWFVMVVSTDRSADAKSAALLKRSAGTFASALDAYKQDVPPDDVARVAATIESVLRGDDAEYYCEYRLRRRDGETRWVAGHGRLIRDAHGKPGRMVGVCDDITQRKIAEEGKALLAEMSRVLATSLESETTLSSLTELLVP
jgi:hypothetical protein